MPRPPHRSLPLPKGWPRRVRSAAVHAIALARMALITARGQAKSDKPISRRMERLTAEILLLKEELRLKDARMSRIPAQRRPHYLPTERLAILELRAARGWSRVQTADHLLVTPATVASWTQEATYTGTVTIETEYGAGFTNLVITDENDLHLAGDQTLGIDDNITLVLSGTVWLQAGASNN